MIVFAQESSGSALGTFLGLLVLAALVFAGLAVFAVSAQLLGAANRHELAAMLRRRD